MKSSVVTINNNLFSSNKEISSAFNAVSGLIVLFSVFTLFALFSTLLLFGFVFESGSQINIMPAAAALMLSVVVGITVFLLSHAIEMIIELINDGE